MTHPAPLSIDDLYRPFQAAEKPQSQWRLGTESERFALLRHDATPLPYTGTPSVASVFAALMRDFGWQAQREHEHGPIIALGRDQASITLEPGGQFELSGAPFHSVHQSAAELAAYTQALQAIGASQGIAWLDLGFHPWATLAELPWIPKLRYRIMRRYLPTQGSRALDMMQRTCTVQVNLDYADEADAMRKLRVALRLQPIVAALFANSPWMEGQTQGQRSQRLLVWLDVDAKRTGLLPLLWRDHVGYRDYIEWALDVPMFLVKRGGRVIENTGQSFRDFLHHGFQGTYATLADWETHLNTLFPEVRLKRTLEVRGVDGQHPSMIPAVTALWKGLLYHAPTLATLETLVADFDHTALQALRPVAAREGLGAKLGGQRLQHWGEQLTDLATKALAALDVRDATGANESQYLKPLQTLLDQGLTPAEVWLRRFGLGPLDHSQFLASL